MSVLVCGSQNRPEKIWRSLGLEGTAKWFLFGKYCWVHFLVSKCYLHHSHGRHHHQHHTSYYSYHLAREAPQCITKGFLKDLKDVEIPLPPPKKKVVKT